MLVCVRLDRTFTITHDIAENALAGCNAEELARYVADIQLHQKSKSATEPTRAVDVGMIRATGVVKAMAVLRRVRQNAKNNDGVSRTDGRAAAPIGACAVCNGRISDDSCCHRRLLAAHAHAPIVVA